LSAKMKYDCLKYLHFMKNIVLLWFFYTENKQSANYVQSFGGKKKLKIMKNLSISFIKGNF